EPEYQQVLERHFAKVVIDAIDLMLGEGLADYTVQRPRALEAVAKRLFDDDAHPRRGRRILHLGCDAAFVEVMDHVWIDTGRDCQVEQTTARRRARAVSVNRFEPLPEGGVGFDRVQIARHIEEPAA